MRKMQLYIFSFFCGVFFMLTGCTSSEVNGMSLHMAFTKTVDAELVDAVTRGDFKQASQKISMGANVNAAGTEGISPLLWVMLATNLNENRMEYLLKAGADPNNLYGRNSLSSAMHIAAEAGDLNVLRLLLKYKANPNLVNGYGATPLFEAVSSPSPEKTIDFLLANGANINFANHRHETAADPAAAYGSFDLVIYFLEHGLTAELQELAKGVEIRIVDDSAQPYKDKVIEMLKQRGVCFPAFDPENPQADACERLNSTRKPVPKRVNG